MKSKVSIIIPVRFRADLAKVCIDSVINYTKVPYELVLVQEGTDQEITELLTSYKTKFVHNKEPKGFAGAMNAGIDVAEGTHYCFLNSDTVVIPNWLDAMMKAFEDRNVGLVTPTYSEMPGRQVIDYNRGQEFDYVDRPLSLKGVCFLISRPVIDSVGKWDEGFGLGGGDDNDMCIRVKRGGYKLVIARKSYVYHYGSASFRELFNNDVDYSKKFAVGQFNKVREKHSLNEKPRVFIAVPNRGTINTHLATLLHLWLNDKRFEIKAHTPQGLYPVDSARNQCVKTFLEDYYDYLLFIDDDIVPPPNIIENLLSADKDVVGALCFTMKVNDVGLNAPFPVAVRKNHEGLYKHYVGNGLSWVDATGCSCLLIKRKVLEVIERPFYFSYHKNGVCSAGEDFNFCAQAKQVGFEVWIDFDTVCGHRKTTDIKDVNNLMVWESENGR